MRFHFKLLGAEPASTPVLQITEVVGGGVERVVDVATYNGLIAGDAELILVGAAIFVLGVVVLFLAQIADAPVMGISDLPAESRVKNMNALVLLRDGHTTCTDRGILIGAEGCMGIGVTVRGVTVKTNHPVFRFVSDGMIPIPVVVELNVLHTRGTALHASCVVLIGTEARMRIGVADRSLTVATDPPMFSLVGDGMFPIPVVLDGFELYFGSAAFGAALVGTVPLQVGAVPNLFATADTDQPMLGAVMLPGRLLRDVVHELSLDILGVANIAVVGTAHEGVGGSVIFFAAFSTDASMLSVGDFPIPLMLVRQNHGAEDFITLGAEFLLLALGGAGGLDGDLPLVGVQVVVIFSANVAALGTGVGGIGAVNGVEDAVAVVTLIAVITVANFAHPELVVVGFSCGRITTIRTDTLMDIIVCLIVAEVVEVMRDVTAGVDTLAGDAGLRVVGAEILMAGMLGFYATLLADNPVLGFIAYPAIVGIEDVLSLVAIGDGHVALTALDTGRRICSGAVIVMGA